MNFSHMELVLIAKSFGLFYLFAMFIAVVIYACWPPNKTKFTDAAKSVLADEDKPCR